MLYSLLSGGQRTTRAEVFGQYLVADTVDNRQRHIVTDKLADIAHLPLHRLDRVFARTRWETLGQQLASDIARHRLVQQRAQLAILRRGGQAPQTHWTNRHRIELAVGRVVGHETCEECRAVRFRAAHVIDQRALLDRRQTDVVAHPLARLGRARVEDEEARGDLRQLAEVLHQL